MANYTFCTGFLCGVLAAGLVLDPGLTLVLGSPILLVGLFVCRLAMGAPDVLFQTVEEEPESIGEPPCTLGQRAAQLVRCAKILADGSTLDITSDVRDYLSTLGDLDFPPELSARMFHENIGATNVRLHLTYVSPIDSEVYTCISRRPFVFDVFFQTVSIAAVNPIPEFAHLTSASVYRDGFPLEDVTEQIRRVAGPAGDFHG
jgi:hypothetical protein